MKPFMGQDFLLDNDTARELYHNHAARMPIIDYHSHVSPQDIAQDRQYKNITELWLEEDHYKWRMMRQCSIDENLITGDASDQEKFHAFAAALPQAAGSPLYHWTHLELRRYFNCDLLLSPATASDIWETCNQRISLGLTAKQIIKNSNVEILCTTDDPVDTLEWHKAIALDKSFDTRVFPTYRPEKVLQIDQPGFVNYINTLGEAAGCTIASLDDLFFALLNRLEHFVAHGCRLSDVSMDRIPWLPDKQQAQEAFDKALHGEPVAGQQLDAYRTELLLFLGKSYAEKGLVMQIHYGVVRNVNSQMMGRVGADTGFDCMIIADCSRQLMAYLDALCKIKALPKTILYNLNPSENTMITCLTGSFPGTVVQGSAWWFNDTKLGMRAQLLNLANTGVLGQFVGMLTDSRSLLSYTRHEYFRRIVCQLLGELVEKGEYPKDMQQLGSMVENISCRNAKAFIGL